MYLTKKNLLKLNYFSSAFVQEILVHELGVCSDSAYVDFTIRFLKSEDVLMTIHNNSLDQIITFSYLSGEECSAMAENPYRLKHFIRKFLIPVMTGNFPINGQQSLSPLSIVEVQLLNGEIHADHDDKS
ncbi:hypothetical protein [Shewanella aestuarii]|uniref:Uncharacterized protein n=1 Tax=Shewanella aestuarii TaxID=1028752 RepID=A0A6G9QRB5_9GAMM|nr:hypothetical protein [Shewanella aestuarii]QIR16595.1 hypothetical protein HBH39_19155 [Shewanella aestuarii]